MDYTSENRIEMRRNDGTCVKRISRTRSCLKFSLIFFSRSRSLTRILCSTSPKSMIRTTGVRPPPDETCNQRSIVFSLLLFRHHLNQIQTRCFCLCQCRRHRNDLHTCRSAHGAAVNEGIRLHDVHLRGRGGRLQHRFLRSFARPPSPVPVPALSKHATTPSHITRGIMTTLGTAKFLKHPWMYPSLAGETMTCHITQERGETIREG